MLTGKIKICQVIVLNQGEEKTNKEGAIEKHAGSTAACAGKAQLTVPSEPTEPFLGSSACINHVLLEYSLKLHSIFFYYHPTVNKVGEAYSKLTCDQFFLLKFPIFNTFSLILLPLPLDEVQLWHQRPWSCKVQCKPSLCSPGVKFQSQWCQDF